ncbi:MAG: TetR/AcrR family transcriptional regulator, partial [Verrucomicrobiaceae bacterium]
MTETSPAVERLPRRERERQRKCQELLQMAEEVFAEKGFHGASMEEIAKAAEYATGALYRYFESKEVLYTAVLEQKIHEMLAFVKERVGSTTDPVEALKLSVKAQLEFASTHRSFIQIYFRERMEVTRAGAHWERIDRLIQDLIQWRAEGVETGQKEGIFRAGEPRLYALALEGMISGLLRDWLTRDTGRSIESHADFVIALGLRGI